MQMFIEEFSEIDRAVEKVLRLRLEEAVRTIGRRYSESQRDATKPVMSVLEAQATISAIFGIAASLKPIPTLKQ